jgi:hypothetical protein
MKIEIVNCKKQDCSGTFISNFEASSEKYKIYERDIKFIYK